MDSLVGFGFRVKQCNHIKEHAKQCESVYKCEPNGGYKRKSLLGSDLEKVSLSSRFLWKTERKRVEMLQKLTQFKYSMEGLCGAVLVFTPIVVAHDSICGALDFLIESFRACCAVVVCEMRFRPKATASNCSYTAAKLNSSAYHQGWDEKRK